MKEFFDEWLPKLWGFLWTVSITVLSAGITIAAIKWLLKVLGVM